MMTDRARAPRTQRRRLRPAFILALVVGVGGLLLTLRPAVHPAAGLSGPGVGEQAPALRLPDLQGHMVRLSSLHGRPVALVFLATWCEGCRVEMPALVGSARALERRGLVLLGVDAVGEDRASIVRFARAYHAPFPVLRDDTSGAMTTFAVRALPTTVVVDGAGRIVLHQEAPIDGATLARAAFGRAP
ncbi:MAG: TlpA family protein disulfide reductase [Chloroflexota bacterium]|nr:TlpA family protein disulfide reductase [Chloroflexota bacterium]